VKSKVRVAVVAFVVLALASQTYAAIVDGVIGPPLTNGPSTGSVIAEPAQVAVIDFDDVTAPCMFFETTALREQYSSFGVHFTGPAENDGGAIINMCGQFSVDARSGENFLAFNREAMMENGGIPTDSEAIEFDQLMTYVSIYAAGGRAEDAFTMDAYDALGNLIDTDTVATQGWAELSVSSQTGISRIVLTQTGDRSFLYDDLSFEAIPEPATLLILGFGALALRRKPTR